MKILIIGTGAIGIALGASLGEQGHEISCVAREKTGKMIEQSGMHRTGIFGNSDLEGSAIHVYYDYESLPTDTFDYICVSLKTMKNEIVAPALSKRLDCLKEKGIIVLMQNGWGNHEVYAKYIPKERIYNARVITGFQRTEPNVSNITVHTGPLMIGSLFGYPCEAASHLAEAINRTGIESHATPEIGKALWAKMLYNCTLNPLGAILKVPYGKLADNPYTTDIMNRLIDETFAVMTASDYDTYWDSADAYKAEFFGKLIPNTYAHRSSTLQDIEKGKKTEIETLTGIVIELGKRVNVPTPTHGMIFEMVRFMEMQFESK